MPTFLRIGAVLVDRLGHHIGHHHGHRRARTGRAQFAHGHRVGDNASSLSAVGWIDVHAQEPHPTQSLQVLHRKELLPVIFRRRGGQQLYGSLAGKVLHLRLRLRERKVHQGYRFSKPALRFSTNAAMPSFASYVSKRFAKASRS